LRLLIRFAVMFVLVLAAMSFLRRAFSSGATERRDAATGVRGGSASRLVRDPVCGTYVAAEGSLTARVDATTEHFCSEACRDKFVSAHNSASS